MRVSKKKKIYYHIRISERNLKRLIELLNSLSVGNQWVEPGIIKPRVAEILGDNLSNQLSQLSGKEKGGQKR